MNLEDIATEDLARSSVVISFAHHNHHHHYNDDDVDDHHHHIAKSKKGTQCNNASFRAGKFEDTFEST